ncbi:hypothetical protein Droror1_Dr00025420, partial [Drosera rotundifolia]
MDSHYFHHNTRLTPHRTSKTTPHHNNPIHPSYLDWIFHRLMELKRGVGYARWKGGVGVDFWWGYERKESNSLRSIQRYEKGIEIGSRLGLVSTFMDMWCSRAWKSVVGDNVDDLGIGGAGTVAGSGLSFHDAFVVMRFNSIQKAYYEYAGRLPFHDDAPPKAALYRDRFDLLFKRLSRHPHYSKPAFDIDLSSPGSCEIVPIQNLSWQIGRRNE